MISVSSNLNAPNNVFYVDSLAKHLLGTTYIREDTLQAAMTSELFNQHPIRWAFETPIEVHGPFVVTVQFNYENGVNDTLILQQSQTGDALGEKRNSRRVINNPNGFEEGTWLPEYMALAFTQHDYDYMIEPILEVDSFQIAVGITTPPNSSIKIYPTLTSDAVTISGYESIPVSVEVIDMMGKSVLNPYPLTRTTKEMQISLAPLKAGIYMLEIRTPEGITSHRVVKSK